MFETLATLASNPMAAGAVALLVVYAYSQNSPACPVCKCFGTMRAYTNGPFSVLDNVTKCIGCGTIYNKTTGNVFYNHGG